jgi:SnoaL-like domain
MRKPELKSRQSRLDFKGRSSLKEVLEVHMKISFARKVVGFSFVVVLAGSTFVGMKIVAANPKKESGPVHDAHETGRRQTMHCNISTLLTRNLYDVFGENDPARRRAAIDEIYTDDVVFYETSTRVYRGRDEIDRIASLLRTQHPDFRYRPIAEPEEVGTGGRIQWVSGRPGDVPAVAGTDFIIARDGRIAAIYLFFDKLPEPGRR